MLQQRLWGFFIATSTAFCLMHAKDKSEEQKLALKKEKEAVEKLIVSGNNRLFGADLYSLVPQVKQQSAKQERENAIQLWNGMLDKLNTFVDTHGGTAKKSDYQTLKGYLQSLRSESNKLVNSIKLVNNTIFTNYTPESTSAKKNIDTYKWDLLYIKNSLSTLTNQIKSTAFDSSTADYQEKKASLDLILLTARYLSVSAAKAISDIDKEVKKRAGK